MEEGKRNTEAAGGRWKEGRKGGGTPGEGTVMNNCQEQYFTQRSFT